MPLIQISMMPGRTPEQKKGLIRDVCEAVVKNCAVKPESVRVLIQEIAPEHWGVGPVSMAELRATGERK
jgi:4-oxalocrotonate tautomerase